MSGLSEFLLARIAEDEAVTQQATQSSKWWDWHGREGRKEATVRAHEGPYVALNVTNGDAVHIARWDTARVLAECEAKRRIVESCRPDYEDSLTRNDDVGTIAEEVLTLLALPYADHPDYRDEWRP